MDPQLRHVVCFKFREGVTASERETVEHEFASLSKKIPCIADLEWGTNNSPEHLNKGLTHCYILSFVSEQDRDTYLFAPAHLEFVELIKQFSDDVLVLDFWKKSSP